MDNDGLAGAIGDALEGHPRLYYAMTLVESHIPFHPKKLAFFGDAFCDVFNEYDIGLFDSIRLMIRYEKSLKAWQEIIARMDSRVVRDTLIMDYIHPVFMVLCDTPNTFKDQLVRGCVKLAAISKGDNSYLIEEDEKGPIRRNWFAEMRSVCSDSPLGKRLCAIVGDDLYACADAAHFRKIHGAGVHDLSQTLVSGLVKNYSPADGIMMQAYVEPFNLDRELEIADRQRLRMQNAYTLFCEYADYLESELKRCGRMA